MKKIKAAPQKSSRRKVTPRIRTQNSRKQETKIPPVEGLLWDDDRAFRLLMKNSSDIFTLVDSRGKILYRSPSMRRVIKLPEKQVMQTNVLDWIWPEDAEEGKKIFALILRSPGKSVPFQVRFRNEVGAPRWVEGFGTNLLTNPAVGAVLVNYHDITDRKQQEKALEENERRYRELFENATLAIFQSTHDGKVIQVNPEFARMFGYDSPEDVFSSVENVATSIFADPARREEILRLRTESPGLSKFENLYRRKDGSTFWGLLNIRTVTDAAGRMQYFEGFVEDIDDRKRSEQELRESVETFRSIFDNSSAGVALVGLDRQYRMVNPAYCRIFGYTEEEFRKSDFLDITHPEDVELSRKLMRDVLDGKGRNVRFAKRYIHKDGHTIWAEVSSALVYGADGKPSHFVTHILDFTERRRAETALRESEERYRHLFDNSLEGIGLSQGNRIIEANKALLDIFGYSNLDELRAIPLLDTVAPESRESIRQRMQEVAQGRLTEKRFAYKIIRKDGSIRDLEISTDHVTLGDEIFTHSTFRDVTERKRAEEELQTLSRRYETLLAAIPEIIMEVNSRKVYTWANSAGIEFFGDDVIGKEAGLFFEGGQDTYGTVQSLFDGNEETVYVESWQRRKDGQKRLLAWWCRVLKNSRGGVTGALSSARDITEQRQATEEIQILSRFPTENPNPVMRISPEGGLLFANNASRPFLTVWNIEAGQSVPEDFRALIGDVYVTNAIREVEIPCRERIFTCSLTPIQSAGYINVYGRDITERKHAEESLARQAEELQQRNEELARLNELNEHQVRRLIAMRAIDTAITSSFKLELVLNILLGQLTDLLSIQAADVLIYQPDLQTFRLSCGRGFRNTLPQQTFIRKTESYANQAAQLRRIVRIPRLDERADGARIYPKIFGEEFYSYLCIPLLSKGLVKGVLEIYSRDTFELEPEAESFLELVAGQAAIAIDNSELFEGLQASNDELSLAYNDTLTGWARTLELRERGTAGEAQRLADMTVRLAKSLGTNEKELVPMYRGAMLHDIGMMGIPDSILGKAEPLSEEEWTIVRKHPQHAHDLLSSVNYLRPAIDIPYCHHEKWDGSGYPRGLTGTQIPWAARIFAVVDVWDALRSNRPYRLAWTDAEARDYIHQQSGTHFDPKVVQVFFEVIPGL